jgi:hypothetical protein
VIAPDRGGAAELVRRLRAGATFAADDPGALATALLETAPMTSAEGARLRRTIEAEYTWEAACARIRRAYGVIVDAERAESRNLLEAPEGWWPAQTSAPAPGALGNSGKFGGSV